MIVYRDDSDGQTHQVWQQNQLNSCGVACVWMARGAARRMSFVEGEWGLAQRVYRSAVGNALAPLGANADGPMTFDPGQHTNDQNTMANAVARYGFFAAQLATALRGESLKARHVPLNGNRRSFETNLPGDGKPAIALVYWNGGGGHFICAVRRSTSGRIVVLDPWDGQLREIGNTGFYNPGYNSGQIGEIIYVQQHT